VARIAVPPPEAEACLTRPYPSSQKGGTLVAEDVVDLETHERRLACPELYRPKSCPRCGARLHIHDCRVRGLLEDPAVSTEVLRFRCADRQPCGATWQVLPAFIARHLWRSWRVVEEAVELPQRCAVPERSRRRWQARLASAGRLLVTILTTTARQMWTVLATAAGLGCSRLDLVREYRRALSPARGECLAELAGLIHRLAPGVRLM
jgi:hypothetical protein